MKAIQVQHLSKKYQIGEAQSRYRTLRDSLVSAFRRHKAGPANEIWALKDVSFEVEQGEVLGIIGRNGAGKSTLLKLLAHITRPTEGRVVLRGRVGSLLEVGTGFHPELTGRENIFLNGAVLGMKRKEIERKFDEIVNFAEIGKFLDTPVKHYSSGMYMRLAFSVAAHLEPEILLVDEVLAVGDSAFQKKCLGKMSEVSKEGRTVLFVSHNMAAVQNLCARVILIDQGQKDAEGLPGEVVAKYMGLVNTISKISLGNRTDRKGDGALQFVDCELLNMHNQPVSHFVSGQDGIIALNYALTRTPLFEVKVEIGVHGLIDENLFHLSTEVSGCNFDRIDRSGTIFCVIPKISLQPGYYPINIYCSIRGVVSDWIINATNIQVESGDFYSTGKMPPLDQGPFLVPNEWRLIQNG